ncbi:LysE family transporter [Acinetobacter sp. B5B]|uniref:LysE family transporter n=1 Tax=Acinetobacter baretiae TaxID=2605383 RepID=UPI0018C2981B|nr:LysE family transporter [Acinetobacter baretiae]MBF7683470.1 LysE family transporter [Acinetobacter baretiae]MBF7684776.1 LysE family transporter [Acinetobacter baretiae]
MFAALLTLALINLCALLTPGPDFFLVTQTAISRSRKAALSIVLGVTAGVVFWVTLTLLGLNILFEQVVWLKQLMFIAGGAYLTWLGIQLLRTAFKPSQSTHQTQDILDQEESLWRFFFKGLLTNLSNPKAIIYFGSVFTLFLANPALEHAHVFLFLIVVVETLLWFLAVTFIFSLPRCKLFYQRSIRWIDGISGGLFTMFGVFLMNNR